MRRTLRVGRAVAGLLVLNYFLLAGCTGSPPPSGGSSPTSAATTTTAAPLASTPPQNDPSLAEALLTNTDVVGLGLAQPTMRSSHRYPDGLVRCDEVAYQLGAPDNNESVGWTLSSPPTEVVHSVSRYSAGAAARGVNQLNEIVAWCVWRDGRIGATHKQPITLPALEHIDAKYAVCYVWVALTWCNIALQRGDVISAIRLGWGAGSKMSLANVEPIAQVAAQRLAEMG